MLQDLDSSSKFITTEPLGKIGESGEKQVWDAIQSAFKTRDCLAYWRYPIFSQVGKYRKEPDILIADRELGLIVIEVKSIPIEKIVRISGHRWEYQNFYTTYGSPYSQAENQLYSLLEYCNSEPSLKQNITSRVLIALPYITLEEWENRGFASLPTTPPILFANSLADTTSIYAQIENSPTLTHSKPLTDSQWQLLLSILAGTPLYRQPPHPVFSPEKSRGKVLQALHSSIRPLDLQQEIIAKQIPPGPQRIRGIAGSGKTVLLCQKAAHIHLKYPEWKIAIVFFSRSLYSPILEQIESWLRYFSRNSSGYDANNSNLQIFHAWGSKAQPGFYSSLCQSAGVYPLAVKDTQSKQPNEALAEACLHLLQKATIPQIFDAILIDEGQDFIVRDAFLFDKKQPFYWLAYSALRPVNTAQPEQRRLIWAYDELQSLDSLSVPTASELFGEDLGHLVTGEYSDGIQKTEILSRCHRTPHFILTAAHAIAMGFLRPEGMLTGMTRVEDWQATGYQATIKDNSKGFYKKIPGQDNGSFTPNSQITLQRPLEESPNPIAELWENPPIEFKAYSTRQEELTALANNIINNLRYEGLRPSREILILILGSYYEAKQLEIHTAQFLMQQGLDIYIPGTAHCNSLKRDREYANQFWCDGAITLSKIHSAKGHEADMVYIIGFDHIAQSENNLSLRNQLFVALTRSRAWVKLSGIGAYKMYEEMQQVLLSGDTFTFSFRQSPSREISLTDTTELLKSYADGGRNFQNANLSHAQLIGVQLPNINLIHGMLKRANLSHANLNSAKLIVANLNHAQLIGASLQNAKLIGAKMQYTNLSKANLSYADLSNADLSNADLTHANLVGVNLTGANLTGVDLTEVNLEKAVLDEAIF